MNYLKVISFGALLWAIAFIIVSVFVGFGVSPENPSVKAIVILALAFASFLLGKNLRLDSEKEILKNSLGWLIVVLLLDSVATVQFTGWGFFKQWNAIAGYLLIAFLPLLAVEKEPKKSLDGLDEKKEEKDFDNNQTN